MKKKYFLKLQRCHLQKNKNTFNKLLGERVETPVEVVEQRLKSQR